jgi:hypothetical protein
MTYHFDIPDFDDAGGRTTRRVEVPNRIVRQIAEAERERIVKYLSCNRDDLERCLAAYDIEAGEHLK